MLDKRMLQEYPKTGGAICGDGTQASHAATCCFVHQYNYWYAISYTEMELRLAMLLLAALYISTTTGMPYLIRRWNSG